jgi:hypothetical protein
MLTIDTKLPNAICKSFKQMKNNLVNPTHYAIANRDAPAQNPTGTQGELAASPKAGPSAPQSPAQHLSAIARAMSPTFMPR